MSKIIGLKISKDKQTLVKSDKSSKKASSSNDANKKESN